MSESCEHNYGFCVDIEDYYANLIWFIAKEEVSMYKKTVAYLDPDNYDLYTFCPYCGLRLLENETEEKS